MCALCLLVTQNLQCTRFRQVPTFGQDTIRKFTGDVSEMKKMAARDFEDILQVSNCHNMIIIEPVTHKSQVAMPLFEGLFYHMPALDNLVQDLLYILATWHAYAKARLHTQTSLNALSQATTTLGHLLRVFRRETSKIDTKETPKEKAARSRRKARQAEQSLKSGKPAKQKQPAGADNTAQNEGRSKRFNMFTYKMHSLGSYVRAIKTFGTSDNFSTQLVSPCS
jgi:hypothetical protein